jgi:hypothetical protein
MIILCQGDFREHIEKLVSMLFYMTENFSEKTKYGHIFYSASVPKVNDLFFRNFTACMISLITVASLAAAWKQDFPSEGCKEKFLFAD